jgi:hypothetical protein
LAPDIWYQSFTGMAPKRIAHWEHWSCPDAKTHITGIDYYEHPRRCREEMRRVYPFMDKSLALPEADTPRARPGLGDRATVRIDADGNRHVRWGDAESTHWDFGKQFTSAAQVFAFSPLAARPDLLDEAAVYALLRREVPPEYGDETPAGASALPHWYNTMFMWPLLTFGWELFLQTCLDPRFDRLMEEFAELNRHVFRAAARLPVSFFLCHDDIVNTRGPVCSPAWMNKHIFPRYEEFRDILKAGGKQVIFMSDGNMDAYADEVMACGAIGIISEPSTDYKRLARRFANCFLAGEGDNRVLMRNNPAEIRAMVESMVETARMSGGYMMCVGNHIPWNVPPEAVKRYLDTSSELGYR